MGRRDNTVHKYMVEFDVPRILTEEILEKIPDQMATFDQLIAKGKLLSYCFSMNRQRLWAVFLASSESELLTYLDMLPLTPYMDYDYSELMFYSSISMIPSMSLN